MQRDSKAPRKPHGQRSGDRWTRGLLRVSRVASGFRDLWEFRLHPGASSLQRPDETTNQLPLHRRKAGKYVTFSSNLRALLTPVVL